MAVNSERRYELLKWFLDFINLDEGDMELLGHGERLKLIAEVLYIIHFGVPTQKISVMPRFDKAATHKKISKWDAGTELEECHAFLRASIESMMGKIHKAIDSDKGSLSERRRKSIFTTLKTTATVRVQIPILVQYPYITKENSTPSLTLKPIKSPFSLLFTERWMVLKSEHSKHAKNAANIFCIPPK